MSAQPGTPATFPERIGRYELLLPLGAGGMAGVYLARSRGVGGFEREVAIKLMHPHLRDEPGWAVELIEEAKLAARIRHPNVVPVLDVDEDPFGVFLVMDYVEGESLSALVRAAIAAERALPLPIVLRILCDVLGGLHAAHELKDDAGVPLGLVHRDVSPQNVLVGVDGITRLTDFGVAKAASRVGQTRTGMVKGKVGYMSPEQARGLSLDRRSDVWAAGVVAWEALARRRLYSRGDEMATLLSIATEDPPRLREVRPELPPALDEAVQSALVRDPAARCPSAAALRERLLEAWRPQGALAELGEVSAFVGELVGPKLEERRARVAEVLELRARMARLVRTAASSSPSASSDQAAVAPAAPVAAELPTTVEPRTGEASGVTRDAERSARGRRLGVLAASVMALAAVAGVAAWLALGGSAGSPAPLAQPITAPLAPVSAAPPPAARAPKSTASAATAPPPAAGSTQPGTVKLRRPLAPEHAARPKAPDLAPSPY